MRMEADYTKNKVIKKAIGYKRISTDDQSQFSLENQEDFIRREAQRQDYELLKVFEDKGFSAKTINRPGLIELLEYCRKNKDSISTLFIYKYDRLSRDTYDFLGIKRKMSEYGIRVISCTEPTDDNPSGEFLSTILSAVAKLDNQMRGQRALEGMKKRFETGWYAAGRPPLGYINSVEDGRKIIARDPKTFDLIKRAWEEMAAGTYSVFTITKLIQSWGLKIPKQTVNRVFRNNFYIGTITSKRWASDRKGLHERMITEDIFYRVQAILDGRSHTARPRVRNNPLFPLRGLVKCGVCLAPLTGAWAKGSTKKYAYYYCSKRTHKAASIPKDTLEGEFARLLKKITPAPEVRKLFIHQVKTKWHALYDNLTKQQDWLKTDIEKLNEQKLNIGKKNADGVIPDDLCKELLAKADVELVAKKSIANESTLAQVDIDTLTNFMNIFLEDLSKAWLLGNLEQRQILVSSIMPQGVVWNNNAYRTTDISPSFLYLSPKPTIHASDGTFSEPAGIRTQDQELKRLLLYR
jgi:site-specific DNA recombinase